MQTFSLSPKQHWRLIIAAKKVILQFNQATIQQHFTDKQFEAYAELQEAVHEIAPFPKEK